MSLFLHLSSAFLRCNIRHFYYAINKQLDNFDFYNTEREINTNIVEEIEEEISKLNSIEYKLNYEIKKLNESLSKNISFDLKKIQQLFEEVNFYFPDQIVRKYSQLLEFNNQITQERNKYQEETLKNNNAELTKTRERLSILNDKRQEHLSVIQEVHTFTKYKKLQSRLVELEAEITHLTKKLENIDIIKTINKSLENLKREYEETTNSFVGHMEETNESYIKLKTVFRELVQNILGESSILYYKINKEKNPDFFAEFVNIDESKITSQSDGYSYKKMLCVCFDLALLITYSSENFYRFVYHDGTLESLSNTRKIKYIEVIRQVCKKYNLQYIFTALTDDLPRDYRTNRIIEIKDSEIALILNDKEDNSGRLFSMKF